MVEIERTMSITITVETGPHEKLSDAFRDAADIMDNDYPEASLRSMEFVRYDEPRVWVCVLHMVQGVPGGAAAGDGGLVNSGE